MPKKNEKTSPAVASKASHILDEVDRLIGECKAFQRMLTAMIHLLEDAKSVSASALTQAPDKK